MPRRPKSKPQASPPAPERKQSPVRRWMREALITGAVLLIVALILAKGLTEETTALILGLGGLVGAVYFTALPVAEHSKSRRVAAGLYAFAVVWVLAAAYPFWKMIKPGDPIKSVSLEEGSAAKSLGELKAGRYLLLAEVARTNLASEAAYRIVVETGGRTERLSGLFSRSSSSRRTFGGQTSRGESVHTADYHEVKLDSGDATIRLDSVEGALSGAIDVRVFPDAAPRGLWFAVQILILAVATLLDALFAERKRRSTLTVGACFTLLLIEVTRASIRPGHLMNPLFGAAIAAIIGGALGGYLLNFLARVTARAVRKRLA